MLFRLSKSKAARIPDSSLSLLLIFSIVAPRFQRVRFSRKLETCRLFFPKLAKLLAARLKQAWIYHGSFRSVIPCLIGMHFVHVVKGLKRSFDSHEVGLKLGRQSEYAIDGRLDNTS